MGYEQPVILLAVTLLGLLFLKRGFARWKSLFADIAESEDPVDYNKVQVREDAYEACVEEAALKKS
jgi:hypothetical protein